MRIISNTMMFIGACGGFFWIPVSQIYFKDMDKLTVLFCFVIFQILWIMGRMIKLEEKVKILEGNKHYD